MVGTTQNLFHNCSYRIFYTTKFEPKKTTAINKTNRSRKKRTLSISNQHWKLTGTIIRIGKLQSLRQCNLK